MNTSNTIGKIADVCYIYVWGTRKHCTFADNHKAQTVIKHLADIKQIDPIWITTKKQRNTSQISGYMKHAKSEGGNRVIVGSYTI